MKNPLLILTIFISSLFADCFVKNYEFDNHKNRITDQYSQCLCFYHENNFKYFKKCVNNHTYPAIYAIKWALSYKDYPFRKSFVKYYANNIEIENQDDFNEVVDSFLFGYDRDKNLDKIAPYFSEILKKGPYKLSKVLSKFKPYMFLESDYSFDYEENRLKNKVFLETIIKNSDVKIRNLFDIKNLNEDDVYLILKNYVNPKDYKYYLPRITDLMEFDLIKKYLSEDEIRETIKNNTELFFNLRNFQLARIFLNYLKEEDYKYFIYDGYPYIISSDTTLFSNCNIIHISIFKPKTNPAVIVKLARKYPQLLTQKGCKVKFKGHRKLLYKFRSIFKELEKTGHSPREIAKILQPIEKRYGDKKIFKYYFNKKIISLLKY